MGLVVASFHRSGSSSLMQHLSQSGLHAGDDLMSGNRYNPDGYFEDLAPVRFHDAVLKEAGLDWTSLTGTELAMGRKHRAFIKDYCAKRAARTLNWGFKDPRVCHFLQHWLGIDPTLNALILYRSPVESSWSLYRRAARELALGLEEDLNSRILRQPDHALALWVVHNRKLLDARRRFPDRSVVISHAGFAAGFNVAAAVRDRFGMELFPADVEQTFKREIVTQTVEPLPVSNRELCAEALDIWNQLQSMVLAKEARGEARDTEFQDDPSGLLLQNDLLSNATRYAREYVRSIEVELQSARCAGGLPDPTTKAKLIAARTVARKLKRWPFALFFSRSRKYSTLIDEILASD